MTEMKWPNKKDGPNIETLIRYLNKQSEPTDQEKLYTQLISHPLTTIKDIYLEKYLK